jgi:membrane-bound lytic murein transglycosylase MltF
MEEGLVKHLKRLAKIVGISILMLVFMHSIPCVAEGHQSARAALSDIQAENRGKNQTPRPIKSFRDESSNPLSRVDFPALVAGKTSSVRSLQKTEAIYFAASEFLETVKNDDMLERFLKKQETHSQPLDFANMHTFMTYILERLQKFRVLFERLAGEYNLDWRLLAAIAYQESHWNPEAVSPTGVCGLMMLTRDTAKYVGITNRTDPEQSVRGGARYFTIVKKKIPERIPEPDRTWLALASYNMGFGHLEDARILTQRLGGNPDSWQDVKKRLPLLSVQKWHSRTKHGYARGHEPVKYVQNIHNYYSILKLLTRESGWSARADAGGGLPDS